jgi:hypothetical protein
VPHGGYGCAAIIFCVSRPLFFFHLSPSLVRFRSLVPTSGNRGRVESSGGKLSLYK